MKRIKKRSAVTRLATWWLQRGMTPTQVQRLRQTQALRTPRRTP